MNDIYFGKGGGGHGGHGGGGRGWRGGYGGGWWGPGYDVFEPDYEIVDAPLAEPECIEWDKDQKCTKYGYPPLSIVGAGSYSAGMSRPVKTALIAGGAITALGLLSYFIFRRKGKR